MRKLATLLLTLASVTSTAFVAEAAESAKVELTKEQLRTYSQTQKLLYPDKPDVYRMVITRYPENQTFTRDQILAATDPNPAQPVNDYSPKTNGQDREYDAWGHVPKDAFSPEDARTQLARYEALHPGTRELWKNLVAKYGTPIWYLARELRDVEENGEKPHRVETVRPTDDPVGKEADDSEEKHAHWETAHPFQSGLSRPLIRQSWRDVLYDEDPSQSGNGAKVLSDLVGASVAYSHNGRSSIDSWSVLGALILPWKHGFQKGGENAEGERNPLDWLVPTEMAVAPSLSINRVDTNGDPKGEIDTLAARLGIYADWTAPKAQTTDPNFGLQARLAGAYVTDTGGHGGLPAGELDLEPRWSGPLPLGYTNVILTKAPLLGGGTDTSLFDTQLRVWLHMEGGDVQSSSTSWDPTEKTFFRLGPTAQLQLNFPKLPPFDKSASITALYSYLAPIAGSKAHRSFLQVTAAYTLLRDVERNYKVSLTAQYQRGGTNLTKEDVDLFTLGLSVLF